MADTTAFPLLLLLVSFDVMITRLGGALDNFGYKLIMLCRNLFKTDLK